MKARQLGFTTDESVDSLDDVLFNRNYDALIISYDADSSLDIFNNKVELAWLNLPDWLRGLYTLDADNVKTLKFDFGDKTFSSISVRSSGRSGTYARVHISEFAKICKKYPEKAKEIITGTIPAVPLGGRIDIESTAEGEQGEFYEMFWEAWNRGEPTRPTEFKAHFYNWQWDKDEINKITSVDAEIPNEFKDYQREHNQKAALDPRLQPIDDIQLTYYYYKFLSLNKDWGKLRQEYPTTPEEAFISSGNKLFDVDRVLKQIAIAGEVVGDWIYYDKFNPKHRYALGADVSEGVGRDSSTGIIWDFTANKVVAEYKNNKIAPDLFAYELKNGAERFGSNVLIAVERNNHGHTTLSKLKEIYPAQLIYREIKTDKLTEERTEKLGWHTNVASKPKMLFDLSSALNDDAITVSSKALLWEMRTYDQSDLGEIKGDENTRHHDLLMAAAIGFQMRTEAISDEQDKDDFGDLGLYTTNYQ